MPLAALLALATTATATDVGIAPLPMRCGMAASGEYCCGRVLGPVHCPSSDPNTTEALVGAPIAAFVEGAWHVAPTTLKPVGKPTPLSGTDRIGKFEGTQLDWLAGATPFRTALKNYDSPPCVVFDYSFPEGANGTAHKLPGHEEYSLITNFPAFKTVTATHAIVSTQTIPTTIYFPGRSSDSKFRLYLSLTKKCYSRPSDAV